MERWLNKYATIDDPKALEDIRKGFLSLLGVAVKQGAEQDANVLRASIGQIDAQLARLLKAARAHDPGKANTASL